MAAMTFQLQRGTGIGAFLVFAVLIARSHAQSSINFQPSSTTSSGVVPSATIFTNDPNFDDFSEQDAERLTIIRIAFVGGTLFLTAVIIGGVWYYQSRRAKRQGTTTALLRVNPGPDEKGWHNIDLPPQAPGSVGNPGYTQYPFVIATPPNAPAQAYEHAAAVLPPYAYDKDGAPQAHVIGSYDGSSWSLNRHATEDADHKRPEGPGDAPQPPATQ